MKTLCSVVYAIACKEQDVKESKQLTRRLTGAMVAEGCCITTKTFGARTIRLAAS
jgi:hypothetical protein